MKRIRIGIIGAGALTEWSLLPLLSGPDAVSAPDTGAWWGRRPLAETEIQYQAPARPEIVTLADAGAERAARVAAAWRIRSHYGDWRRMLKEVELDALFCLAPPEAVPEIVLSAVKKVEHIWIDGPPAPTAAAARVLAGKAAPASAVWCAHPLRHAAAHRAAWRLIERGAIGPVSAVNLRWGLPLHAPAPEARSQGAGAPYLASSYAAFDLISPLLARGQDVKGLSAGVMGSECQGSTSLLLHAERGPSLTALFAGADNWSSPLPRLEVCGTEGRSIVCEAGRRLWVHEPREAARFLEPPGLASYISAANIAGLAEDVKEFLAAAAGFGMGQAAGNSRSPGEGRGLAEAAHILSGVEAAAGAVRTGAAGRWERYEAPAADSGKNLRTAGAAASEAAAGNWAGRDGMEALFPGAARETSLTLPL